MPNNRMYLYCPDCDEVLFIAKHFGSWFDLRAKPDDIDSFFRKHQACHTTNAFDRGSQIVLRYSESDNPANKLPEPGPVFEKTKTFDPQQAEV